MSNMTTAAIVTPIIAAIALAFWLFMVFRADAHPLYKHQSNRPPGDVSGGSFSASGGRQVMPRPDAQPSVSVPSARTAQHGEQYEHGEHAPAAEERQASAGSDLR